MSWPLWLRQKVRDFVDLAALGPWPQMRDQARRLADELPPEEPRSPGTRARARAKPRGGVDKSGLPFAPVTGPSQRGRRGDRNDRVWDLRWVVLRRAKRWFGNFCEFCRCGEPQHLHHVLKGSDRVSEEDESTGAAVCRECHDRTEESPAWAREQGLVWALRLAAEARRRQLDELAARFDRTAEILEGKIALAAAQARPVARETT